MESFLLFMDEIHPWMFGNISTKMLGAFGLDASFTRILLETLLV
jgi:hypothetical protein